MERFVMLENVSKSDLVAVVGLGLAAAVMSELLPNARPVIRSAIQFGVDLLTESEAEAEAEAKAGAKAGAQPAGDAQTVSKNRPDSASD